MRLSTFLSSLILSICLPTTSTNAHSTSRNRLNYLSLIESPQIQTPSHRVHSTSHFDLTFDIHKHTQHIRLKLEPNHDILHEDARVDYIDQDGNVRHTKKINRHEHKVFQGTAHVVDEDGTSSHTGWARIVVRRDGVDPLFEGAFTIMGDHHHIQSKSTYERAKHVMDPELEDSDDEYMVMWRDSDVSRQSYHGELKRSAELACGADQLEFNSNPQHLLRRDMLKQEQGSWGTASLSSLLGKRQNIDGGGIGNGNSAGVNLRNTIGNTAGCPTTRKVALVGIATDCTYTSRFASSESLENHIVGVVNTASDLYQSTFNITLGLRTLTVSDAACPGTATSQTPWNVGCNAGTSITQRLNLFSQWRGQQSDTNAYWSLFTTCNTGAEVGLAWLGQLCNHGSTSQTDTSGQTQSVTGANVVAMTSTEWQVFAHETGHTFGAVHDCDSSTCQNSDFVNSNQCCPLSSGSCDANAQFLMNPFSRESISQFSPCSVGNICSALGRNSVNGDCLSDNKGVITISGQVCGNGIVEGDEDCDCGGVQGCTGNACCNPETCRFYDGAVCDPSNEGCCSTACQFAAAGTVCRASTGECDPQETCSGTNGTCPVDTTAEDGTDCGNGLRCASGQCTSRDQQCQTLMGTYTSNNDTYACNSQTCILSCASPDFGINVCYSMEQNFLDGTPCNGGGRCNNGVCSGSTTGGEIRSWIEDNRTLVIALASAIGGLLLLGILGCCIRACRRPRGKRLAVIPGVGRQRRHAHGNRRGWDGPAVPQAMRERGYGGNGGGYDGGMNQNQSQYQAAQQYQQWYQQQYGPGGSGGGGAPPQQGSGAQQYPSQPPPAYNRGWSSGGGQSTRYA